MRPYLGKNPSEKRADRVAQGKSPEFKTAQRAGGGMEEWLKQ
jgi:hypothetical protein